MSHKLGNLVPEEASKLSSNYLIFIMLISCDLAQYQQIYQHSPICTHKADKCLGHYMVPEYTLAALKDEVVALA